MADMSNHNDVTESNSSFYKVCIEGSQSNMCTLCGLDFQLPKRLNEKSIRDLRFNRIPRTLPCLHGSMCHSCIDERWQQRDDGIIECHHCNARHNVPDPAFLPLDFTTVCATVHNVYKGDRSRCSRCFDDAKGFSWCVHCQESLCDFHHRDHRLSQATSGHEILIETEPGVQKCIPSIPCVESIGEISNCVCLHRDCKRTISDAACLQPLHANHATMTVSNYYHACGKANIQAITANSQRRERDLTEIIDQLQEKITVVNRDSDALIEAINKDFSSILQHLEVRRKSCCDAVDEIRSRKLAAMSAALAEASVLLSSCQRAFALGSVFSTAEVGRRNEGCNSDPINSPSPEINGCSSSGRNLLSLNMDQSTFHAYSAQTSLSLARFEHLLRQQMDDSVQKARSSMDFTSPIAKWNVDSMQVRELRSSISRLGHLIGKNDGDFAASPLASARVTTYSSSDEDDETGTTFQISTR
jgi:hypothetical protein